MSREAIRGLAVIAALAVLLTILLTANEGLRVGVLTIAAAALLLMLSWSAAATARTWVPLKRLAKALSLAGPESIVFLARISEEPRGGWRNRDNTFPALSRPGKL